MDDNTPQVIDDGIFEHNTTGDWSSVQKNGKHVCSVYLKKWVYTDYYENGERAGTKMYHITQLPGINKIINGG